jgi:ABC-2 type transport system permease protein
MMITSCLVIVVVLPFALFASVGRGYLLPIGVAILTLILANLAAVIGLAPYFPWAIPGLYAQGQGTLVPISCPIVMLTGVAGMAGTYLWWKYADQSR